MPRQPHPGRRGPSRPAASQAPLQTPYALDGDGHLVHARAARREGAYRCPSCLAPVTPRQGTVQRAHFGHGARTPDSPTRCTNETVAHQSAKLAVIETIVDWKAGRGPAPMLRRPCVGCGNLVDQPLPDTVATAVAEHAVEGIRRRLDVGLLDSTGALCAGIELRFTHAIDDPKIRDLRGLPLVELATGPVLTQHASRRTGPLWTPQRDLCQPAWCSRCRPLWQPFETVAARIAAAAGQRAPDPDLRYLPWRCNRCARWMVLYVWPDMLRGTSPPPPLRDPKVTVRVGPDPSHTRHRWAQRCPWCGKPQVDHVDAFGSRLTDYPMRHLPTGGTAAHDRQRMLGAVVRNHPPAFRVQDTCAIRELLEKAAAAGPP